MRFVARLSLLVALLAGMAGAGQLPKQYDARKLQTSFNDLERRLRGLEDSDDNILVQEHEPPILNGMFWFKPSCQRLSFCSGNKWRSVWAVGDAVAAATCATQIIAGSGLTGGGSLLLDRTLNLGGGWGQLIYADSTKPDTTPGKLATQADLLGDAYSAAVMTVRSGLLVSGTVDSTFSQDGKVVTVYEGLDPDPLIVDFRFTYIPRFTYIGFYGRYEGSGNQHIVVELYDWTQAAWTRFGVLDTATTNSWHTYPVFDGADYISSTVCSLRFKNDDYGMSVNYLYIDYTALGTESWGGGINSHSLLSGLNQNDHPQYTPDGQDADSIRGNVVSRIHPTNNYVLKYNQASDSIIWAEDVVRSVYADSAGLAGKAYDAGGDLLDTLNTKINTDSLVSYVSSRTLIKVDTTRWLDSLAISQMDRDTLTFDATQYWTDLYFTRWTDSTAFLAYTKSLITVGGLTYGDTTGTGQLATKYGLSLKWDKTSIDTAKIVFLADSTPVAGFGGYVTPADVPSLETDAAHDNFSEIGGSVTDGQVPDNITITETGDISAVTAGRGITGGGTTGAVIMGLDTTLAYTWGGAMTFSGNCVNTANPWADAEIASSATWNNRLDSASIATWPDTVSGALATKTDIRHESVFIGTVSTSLTASANVVMLCGASMGSGAGEIQPWPGYICAMTAYVNVSIQITPGTVFLRTIIYRGGVSQATWDMYDTTSGAGSYLDWETTANPATYAFNAGDIISCQVGFGTFVGTITRQESHIHVRYTTPQGQ